MLISLQNFMLINSDSWLDSDKNLISSPDNPLQDCIHTSEHIKTQRKGYCCRSTQR